MLEVAYVGDVSDVAHLETEMPQIAEKDVEGDCRAGVAQVGVAIHRRPAYIHPDKPLVEGLEGLFGTGQ